MTPQKDFSVARAFIFLVRWFNVERAIGFSLLFSAAVMAFEPLLEDSLVELLILETGLNPVVVSHWYLLGGLYLLLKGNQCSFATLILVLMPMFIITLSAFLVAILSNDPNTTVNGSDVAREVMISSLLIQRVLSKLTVELIEKIGDVDHLKG